MRTKWFLMAAGVNVALWLVAGGVCAFGLAVHRTHSFSVAVEIAKTYGISDDKRDELAKMVSKTGGTDFYYSSAFTAAEAGIAGNLAVILWWIIKRKKQAGASPS